MNYREQDKDTLIDSLNKEIAQLKSKPMKPKRKLTSTGKVFVAACVSWVLTVVLFLATYYISLFGGPWPWLFGIHGSLSGIVSIICFMYSIPDAVYGDMDLFEISK